MFILINDYYCKIKIVINFCLKQNLYKIKISFKNNQNKRSALLIFSDKMMKIFVNNIII